MDFFYLIIASLITGFIASMPIGPINIWITQSAMTNRYKAIKYFVAGVIVADVVYVTLAFSSYYFWVKGSVFGEHYRVLGFIGGLLIMTVGIYNIFKNNKKVKEDFKETTSKIQHYASFLTGLFLTISNAVVFVFWLFVADFYQRNGLVMDFKMWSLLLVIIGVVVGDLIWFSLFTNLLKRGITKISHTNLAKMRLIIAISLVIFGLFTACKQF